MAALIRALAGMTIDKVSHWNRLRSYVARMTESCVPPEIYASPKKLNLGCSVTHLPTYTNVDVQEEVGPEVVCDIRELPFARDDEYDLVRASHVLEHFELRECYEVLAEWRRVLKPGGYLVVCVPNFEAQAWRSVLWPRGLALDEKTLQNGWINGLFALDLPPQFRHKIVFTEKSLRNLLDECGFLVKGSMSYLREEPYTLGIRDDSCNSFSINLVAVKV